MTDDIIKKIKEIDEKYYKENYCMEWYKERYNENNFVFCLYDKDVIVGYICIVGIKEELYNDFKNGKYDNDYDIDSNLFDYKSDYMYLSSINILKDYRHNRYGELLLKEALHNFNNNIIAITVSKEGYNLAKKRMNYIKNINKDTAVFERKEVKNVQ